MENMCMKKNVYMTPSASCIVESDLWMIRHGDNLLVRIDLNKGVMAECIRVQGIDFDARKSWNDRMVALDDKVYFFPDFSADLFVLDIENRKIKKIGNYPCHFKYTLNPVLALDSINKFN